MKVDLEKATLVDASVMRELGGKTIKSVAKNGQFCEFRLEENGEIWNYGWMEGHRLIPGEPCLVLAGVGKAELTQGKPVDGHVNRVFKGKQVEKVTRAGVVVQFHMTNGERWSLAWADPDTGKPQRGEPVLVKVDVKLRLPPVTLDFGAGGL